MKWIIIGSRRQVRTNLGEIVRIYRTITGEGLRAGVKAIEELCERGEVEFTPGVELKPEQVDRLRSIGIQVDGD